MLGLWVFLVFKFYRFFCYENYFVEVFKIWGFFFFEWIVVLVGFLLNYNVNLDYFVVVIYYMCKIF